VKCRRVPVIVYTNSTKSEEVGAIGFASDNYTTAPAPWWVEQPHKSLSIDLFNPHSLCPVLVSGSARTFCIGVGFGRVVITHLLSDTCRSRLDERFRLAFNLRRLPIVVHLPLAVSWRGVRLNGM
jgi:hypothetical protein